MTDCNTCLLPEAECECFKQCEECGLHNVDCKCPPRDAEAAAEAAAVDEEWALRGAFEREEMAARVDALEAEREE